MAKLLIIRGYLLDPAKPDIYCEVYGKREANQLLKAYVDKYPAYTFTLRNN